MNDSNFEIGIVTKPQGIKGEVRVLPTTDDPSRFNLLVGEEVLLNEKVYKISTAREQKNMVILKFSGVNDRNTAETLIGKKILIPAEKALPLEEDEYFARDLPGLKVQTTDGEEIGIVEKVLHTNANDVYVIKPIEGDSFMIPAIKDVVLSISISKKAMTIKLMEGLRELKP